MRPRPYTLIALAAVATAPHAAAADPLACKPAEAGSVEVDGMLDDWDGVAEARAGGKDKDQSFGVRCLVDGDKLAIVVDVRDDRLVRLFKAKGKLQDAEDHLELRLAAGGAPLVVRAWPGTEHQPPRRQLVTEKKGKAKAKAAPAWLAIEDTQQPKGWSVELEVPLGKVAGWSASTASLDATVTFVDADDTEVHTSTPLATDLELGLGDKPDLLAAFLKAAHLKKKDVALDAQADVDPTTPGPERVVAGGAVIGLLGDRFTFVQLPVDDPGDVHDVQLVDLRGDGTREVLARLRQSGGAGTRDLITVWGAHDGQLEQLFAVEVRKEADGNVLESAWKVVAAGTRRAKKGKARPKGQELVVEAKDAVGWDEDTFEEDPADDAEPIHLPWDDARHGGVYWLDGTTLRSQVLKNTR